MKLLCFQARHFGWKSFSKTLDCIGGEQVDDVTIADELNAAKKRVEELEAQLAGAEDKAADQFTTAADRIDVLSAALNDGPLGDKGE